MLTSPPLTLAGELSTALRLGILRAAPIAVRPSGPALQQEMDALAESLRVEHAGKPSGSVPGVAAARTLYRAFKIDPTRTRPSSEALLRRVLQGGLLPRINNAVDLCNLCAVRFLLPIGLYDAAALRGGATARRGLPGESFAGIRKDEVRVEGRPVLADDEGPFGNPTSDSLRTSVATGTTSLLMVVFAPVTFDAGLLGRHLDFARGGVERHLAPEGGRVEVATEVLP